MIFFDWSLDENNFQFRLFSLSRNFVRFWQVCFVNFNRIAFIHLWNNSRLYHRFFKVIGRKQTSKISKLFPCKHKINESNAKVPTHYWIFCLYSKNVSFYVFIPDKFFNFFRKVFNTITIKINNFTSLTKQSNPVCTYVCVFIKVYYLCPILYFFRQIISRIHTI